MATATHPQHITLSIDRMLDASTAHIRDTTAKELDQNLQDKEGPLWDALSYVAWHEYGWIFFVPTAPDIAAGLMGPEFDKAYPELSAVLSFAAAQGVQYLKLDCDAPEIEALPTFNW